jgi:hypothetical protein
MSRYVDVTHGNLKSIQTWRSLSKVRGILRRTAEKRSPSASRGKGTGRRISPY